MKKIIKFLGDKHNEKSTSLMENQSEKYIHKYRNSDTEHALAEFMRLAEEEGFEYCIGCSEIISESETEHDEKIVENTATDKNGIVTYFRKTGALIFFAYLFGSVDLHAENIIASGDTPVLIDLETLFSGELNSESGSSSNLTSSVMKSHLLANFIIDEDRIVDCSGLTGITADGKNLPIYNSEHIFAWKYEKEVLFGFCKAYEFAVNKREKLNEWLDLFNGCRFRQIIRPTDTYARVIAYLDKRDENLRKPLAAKLLERAYKRDINPNRLTQAEKLLKSEIAAVVSGNIPAFFVYGNTKDLHDDCECVMPAYLSMTPVDYAKKRLYELNTSDLQKQVKIIKLSLNSVKPITEIDSMNTDESWETVITDELDRCAVPGLPSVWTKLGSDANGNAYFESAGFNLYTGVTGILCYYAAMYAKTNEKLYLDRINVYYSDYRKYIIDSPFEAGVSSTTCSLSDGLGGQIAALLHIYKLTGIEYFKSDAQTLATKINPYEVREGSCDLLSGLGGLVLSLPKLESNRAHAFAQTLSPLFDNDVPQLTGTAHGMAGYALCLGALQKVLGDNRFDEKIISIINCEDELYNEEKTNWPDLRNPQRHGFMGGWCSGAPGIGMARKKLLSYTANPEIIKACNRDIKRAKQFLESNNISRRDSLCCGAASRLMAISYLEAENDELYNSLAKTISSDSDRLLHIIDTADNNIGLMQGIAGVGYALAMYKNPLSGDMLV